MRGAFSFQYRKQYELHAIFMKNEKTYEHESFQYRKRYELHAMDSRRPTERHSIVSIPQAVWIACNDELFNEFKGDLDVSIPQAVWIACNYLEGAWGVFFPLVSIPQAVWIACNDVRDALEKSKRELFQYRKRYELHAIYRPKGRQGGFFVSIPQAV